MCYDLIHVDLGGPILKETLDLSKYFLVFIDDLLLQKLGFIFCVPKVKPLLNSRFSRSWVKCEIGKKIRST